MFTCEKCGCGTQSAEHKECLKPTEKPTVADIGWAAGIVEGEGTLWCQKKVTKSPRHYRGRWPGSGIVQVCQKDRWLLDRLKAMFGGSVCFNKRADLDKAVWLWRVTGTRARAFAMTIYRFLSPRRQAAVLGMIGG